MLVVRLLLLGKLGHRSSFQRESSILHNIWAAGAQYHLYSLMLLIWIFSWQFLFYLLIVPLKLHHSIISIEVWHWKHSSNATLLLFLRQLFANSGCNSSPFTFFGSRFTLLLLAIWFIAGAWCGLFFGDVWDLGCPDSQAAVGPVNHRLLALLRCVEMVIGFSEKLRLPPCIL